MIENKVKTKWQKKEVLLNSFLSIPNTFTAEIMSEQGYDALTIDYQHGMIGFSDLFKMLQSIRNSGVTPICRVSGLRSRSNIKSYGCRCFGYNLPND